jgi:hypothetical protein
MFWNSSQELVDLYSIKSMLDINQKS